MTNIFESLSRLILVICIFTLPGYILTKRILKQFVPLDTIAVIALSIIFSMTFVPLLTYGLHMLIGMPVDMFTAITSAGIVIIATWVMETIVNKLMLANKVANSILKKANSDKINVSAQGRKRKFR